MGEFKIETVDYVSERKGELYANGKSADGVEGTIALFDVRAAISPPAADTPGYWLLLGTKYKPNDAGKPVRQFLREGQSKNQRQLVDDLIQACGKFCCREVYAPESGLYQYLVKRFWGIQGTSVVPAPNAGDVDYGLALITEALEDKGLEIPKFSILHGQLERLTPESISTAYALPALRYLLAAFTLYQTRRPGSVQIKRSNYFYA